MTTTHRRICHLQQRRTIEGTAVSVWITLQRFVIEFDSNENIAAWLNTACKPDWRIIQQEEPQ